MRRPAGSAGTSIRAAAADAPRSRFRHRGVTVHRDRVFVTYRNWLYALDRNDRPADRVLRRRGPHRPARGPRASPSSVLSVSASTPGVDLRGPADHRQHRARDPARHARPHPRVRRQRPASCAGSSTPFRSPASSATTPGPKDADSSPAAPTPGPASPSTPKLAMVFAATGSASFDFYGVNRHGDNLFANYVLALDARTGKRVWHFQGIKHDIWDWDFPAAAEPGHRDARRQAGRRGRADHQERLRVRARPQDRHARSSRSSSARCRRRPIDGEQRRATQPFPLKPPPFARQGLTEDMLTTRTPEAHAAVLARVSTLLQRSAVHAAVTRRARSSSRASTAARSGAARRSIPRRAALRQLERDAVDHAASSRTPTRRSTTASARPVIATDRTGTPAGPVARRHRQAPLAR